jgi:catechol 2,3-dioxygenase-like lactoylglutathione lyase family enzyme
VSPVRLVRIGLVCRDLEATARFYEAAFGFVREGEERTAASMSAGAIGVAAASARTLVLRLGDQSISLVDITPQGHRYPDGVCGANLLFQHFAIVVADMRLASSGGVTAFKFRDPEGHPLELLSFPEGSAKARRQRDAATPFLGIDHSALSVADTSRSLSFYRRLGLTPGQRSLNTGPEQDRLDGMPGVQVEVTALAPSASPTPHVELLCYRSGVGAPPAAINDVAATRLVLEARDTEAVQALCRQVPEAIVAGLREFDDRSPRALLRDPDGHLVLLEASAP